MKSIKLALLLVASLLFVGACGGSEDTSEVPKETTMTSGSPTAASDEFVSAKNIYKENCAGCHKDDGTGGPTESNGRTIRVPDFTSEKVKRLPDETYLGYIRNGDEEEGMPAFKDKLSPEEMVGLVKMIRTEFQRTPKAETPEGESERK